MPRAVFLASPGKVEVRDVGKPIPAPDQVLIRVHAAALNPTDVKHIEKQYPAVFFDTISGCDFAGVIEEIGTEVPAGLRSLGDRVAGAVHGASSPASGAFAEYLVTDPKLLVALPDSLAFEDAASLGLCGITACQMLWQSQNLPRPGETVTPGNKILVWSGASAVGQLAIQLAAASGLEVIATASPKHWERLRALGASAVFNYADADVGEQINKYTHGTLHSAADCMSAADSTQKIFKALGDGPGVVSILMPVKTEGLRTDVEVKRSVFYTSFGKKLFSPYSSEANPEHYPAAVEYYQILTTLLSAGELKTMPVKLFAGLEQVQTGIEYMQSGKVSGEKVAFKFV